ncbi:MAG: YaiO family outer membrane beta-barrel protein [Elusimicrobiota bacterium]
MKKINFLFITVLGIVFFQNKTLSADNSDLRHSIKLSYEHSSFNKMFNNWALYEIEYKRNLPWMTLLSRIKNAYRFDEYGTQLDIDAYPFKEDSYYFYINLGLSNSDIFPRARFGLEYYKVFPELVEISLGMRYLNYSDDSVILYTSSLWKYLGSFLVSPRIFYSPREIGSSTSFILEVRKDMKNYLDLITLKTGYGISPDTAYTLEIINLNSSFIFLSLYKDLSKYWNIELQGEVKQEEIRDNEYRQKNTFRLTVGRSF